MESPCSPCYKGELAFLPKIYWQVEHKQKFENWRYNVDRTLVYLDGNFYFLSFFQLHFDSITRFSNLL